MIDTDGDKRLSLTEFFCLGDAERELRTLILCYRDQAKAMREYHGKFLAKLKASSFAKDITEMESPIAGDHINFNSAIDELDFLLWDFEDTLDHIFQCVGVNPTERWSLIKSFPEFAMQQEPG